VEIMPTTTAILPEVLGLDPDLVDYQAALELQERTVADVVAGRSPGRVFLLEHQAVYTAGQQARDLSEYPHPVDGTPVIHVNRGGKVTWHGPGQLTCYPILPLADTTGIPLIKAMEACLIAAFAEVGVAGKIVPHRAGVWLDAEPTVKLAQVGVHVSRGVSMHGFAVNCSLDPAVFRTFVPCGIRDAGVSTLSEATGRTLTPRAFLPTLLPHLNRMIEKVTTS
jgi:lipoyl(octanoyl) transferase